MHTLLYGGTFDPIHHGHLIACQRAAELLRADKVLFIPAGISPHKIKTATSEVHRLEMLKLAIAPNPIFAADPRELTRPGPSYTIDTVEELKSENPGTTFTLLLGTDQLPKLHTWYRIADLLAGPRPPVAILPRPSDNTGRIDTATALQSLAATLGRPLADQLARSVLETPLLDISATDIRRRVAANLPIHYLVPEKVAAYIGEHKLYLP